MTYYMTFIVLGYLSGSVLYARLFGYLFRRRDIIQDAKDKNPGTANAFMRGGFFCGILTLCFDLLKGFLPVFLCVHCEQLKSGQPMESGLALVLAAPVIGHIFPVYHHFRGGKGIATTFGCLLGICPYLLTAEVLAFFFILLSLVIRVTPHYFRTIGAYILSLVVVLFAEVRLAFRLGYLLITLFVMVRMSLSKEEKEACKVRVLWMH